MSSSPTKACSGGVTYLMPELDEKLDILFRTASENGLDIDLHVDETQDKETLTLKTIAEAKLRNRFEGSVTVGHCCSLARQDDDLAKTHIDLMARRPLSRLAADVQHVSAGRHPGRTPRQRGVPLSTN